MRKLLVIAAFLAVVPSAARAAPICQAATLDVYLTLPQGCEVGATTFTGFGALPSFALGAVAIDPAHVVVTPADLPAGPQLAFSLSSTAGLDELLGLVIAFAASGSSITGAELALSGASATGTGVVTVVEDLCLGGTFGATPLDCSGSQAGSLVVAADAFGAVSPDARSFSPFTFFDVFVDITLDGTGGSATLAPEGAVITRFAACPPRRSA